MLPGLFCVNKQSFPHLRGTFNVNIYSEAQAERIQIYIFAGFTFLKDVYIKEIFLNVKLSNHLQSSQAQNVSL